MNYTHFITNIMKGSVCGYKDEGRYIGTVVTYGPSLVTCPDCKKLMEESK